MRINSRMKPDRTKIKEDKIVISLLALVLFLFLELFLASLTAPVLAMPVPSGEQFFKYNAAALPIAVSDPAAAQPIGLGSVTEAADKLSIQVGLEAFDGPVDIYIGIFAPNLDPNNVYLVTSGNSLQPLSQGLIPWQANVTGPVSEAIFGDIPVSSLPPGPYNFYLVVAPAGTIKSYYLWETDLTLLSLTVNKMGSGSVSSDVGGMDCGDTCVRTYAPGAAVGLAAAPEEGSDFLKWGGCDVSTGNTCALVMNKDRAVTPMFGTRPELKPNIKVINENITQCLTVTNNTDSSATYSFELENCPDQVTELSHLAEGDVLLIDAEGLSAIVRVTAINSSMPGYIVAETTRGNLFDIADKGTIVFSGTFSPPESASSSAAALKATDFYAECHPSFGPPGDLSSVMGLYYGFTLDPDPAKPCMLKWSDNQGNVVSLALSGHSNFAMGGVFGLSWDWGWTGPYLSWATAMLEVTENTDLTVKANADLNIGAEPKQLYDTSLGVILIGPILIDTHLAFYAIASGHADINFTTGLTSDFGYQTGLKYKDGDGWELIKRWDPPSFGVKPPRLTISSQLKVSIEPQISLLMYDIFGGTFGLEGFMKANESADTAQNKLDWCLSGGLDSLLGAKVSIDGFDLWSDSWDLPIFEIDIAGTCVDGQEVPIGPTAWIETPANPFYTNKPVSFKGSVQEVGPGTVTSCSWDFGDTAAMQSGIDVNGECTAGHSYADGQYTVKLTVSDGTRTATASSRVLVSTTPPPPPSNVKITSMLVQTAMASAITKQAAAQPTQLNFPCTVTWDPPTLGQSMVQSMSQRKNTSLNNLLNHPLDVTYKTWRRGFDGKGALLSTTVHQGVQHNRDVISFGYKEENVCYQLAAVDRYGNQSVLTDPNTCVVAKVPPTVLVRPRPVFPSGLATSNVLTWDEIDDRDVSYTVYRDGIAVKTLVSPPFYDTGLMPGSTHRYKIGLNQNGRLIDTSDETYLTTSSDAVSPTTPAGLAAVAVSSSVLNLSWNPATDNIGVEGYRIYNSNTTGLTYRTAVTGTSLSVSGLSPDTTYCFKVSACDAAGNESLKSTKVCATPKAGVSCTYTISPQSQGFSSGAGSGSFTVTAQAGCLWTANSNAGWITITGGTSGTGNGTVSYAVLKNTGSSSRTATITAAGKTFSITQTAATACTFTLSPTNDTYYSAEGGSGNYTGTFSVTASGSGCSWSALSDSDWITITSGNSGTGSGTGTYTVSPNNAIDGRTGTISVGDQTFTVTQDGLPCTYTISPAGNTLYMGGSGSFSVTTSNGSCSWSATSNAGWLTITSGNSGTGNGMVNYYASPDPHTATYPMTGIITVEDQTFTLTLEYLN